MYRDISIEEKTEKEKKYSITIITDSRLLKTLYSLLYLTLFIILIYPLFNLL